MPEKPKNPLAEIRFAHLLCTHSAPRPGGVNVNKAGCSCGARYEWYRREAEHAEHVDAVIVEHFAAREAAARREALLAFADTRGVNVGDEDSEWLRGYRQAQRECLHAAIVAANAEPERDEESGR